MIGRGCSPPAASAADRNAALVVARLAVEAADIRARRRRGRATCSSRRRGAAALRRAPRTDRRNRCRTASVRSKLAGPVAMILQADPLIGGAAPQEDACARCAACPSAARCRSPSIESELVRSTVSAELSSRRLEPSSSGWTSVQHHFEPRQIARVGIEQPVGTAGRGADVAMAVEHDEGVVMLQRAPRPRGRSGHRNVERRFRDLLGVAAG